MSVNSSASAVPVSPAAVPFEAPKVKAAAGLLITLGVTGLLYLFIADLPRAWSAILQGVMIPTWISLGALVFIALHSIGNAAWTVPLRRVMEGLSSGLPLTLIGCIAIAFAGLPYLYEWANLTDPTARAALFHVSNGSKSAWMMPHRWIITTLAIVVIWMALRHILVRLSIEQDARADIRARHLRWSVIFMIVFGFTFTLFTWDLLLSLHVTVVSAMWGIWCFTSALQTFLAVLALTLLWLRGGPLKDVIKPHLTQDLGTWLVGFSSIWAYITFAQYVVMYFANLNEEAYFFLVRSQHGYGQQMLIEAVLRFPVPFLLLLSQRFRSDLRMQAVAAVSILVGSWLDLSWIIMPAFSLNVFRWNHLPELLVSAGFVGGFLLLALRFWRRHGLVAVGDPKLATAISGAHLH